MDVFQKIVKIGENKQSKIKKNEVKAGSTTFTPTNTFKSTLFCKVLPNFGLLFWFSYSEVGVCCKGLLAKQNFKLVTDKM